MKEPAKLMLAGDWHGNAMWAVKAIHHAKRNGADTILQLGDFGYWRDGIEGLDTRKYFRVMHRALEECDIVLYWIDGNHEDHSCIENMPGATALTLDGYPRIAHLPRGLRWDWWGKTWMALGGAYSVDKPWRREGVSWWPGEALTDEQIEYASRPGKVDVIVAHDAPFGVDIPGIGTATKGGDFPVDQLMASEEHRRKVGQVVDVVNPSLFFHGHYHVRYQNWYGERRTFVTGLDRDETTLDSNTLFTERKVGADVGISGTS
ncbi:hypothetical protein HA138_12510 [Mycobacteroides chelonae]|uniref:metallophosphoesterase n=1 Tax=Mycobacteroides chelonae TaxID=1774 RepID=UPI0018B0957B|nr:hypothetical protein [Mycobacteroides chelonae]